MKNWKTTTFGLAAFLMLIAKFLRGEPITLDDFALAASASGLFAAKDLNVSHTKP